MQEINKILRITKEWRFIQKIDCFAPLRCKKSQIYLLVLLLAIFPPFWESIILSGKCKFDMGGVHVRIAIMKLLKQIFQRVRRSAPDDTKRQAVAETLSEFLKSYGKQGGSHETRVKYFENLLDQTGGKRKERE